MEPNLLRADWVLLAIDASPAKTLSPVQLQKALFLFSRNLDEEQRGVPEFYDFEPYDYGPFDRAVYGDAEALEEEGDIIIDDSTSTGRRRYSATPDGSQRASRLRNSIGPDVQEYLNRVVRWVCSLSFNGLVKAIYAEYPEMKKKSVFQD